MLKKCIKKSSGFTLVELMIVIAIVAILVGLALPNYQNSIRKGRRADAQADLMEFAGRAERVFTQTNSYATAGLPPSTDFYTYTFTVNPTATVFTIQAEAIGAQEIDPCGDMTLDQRGDTTNTSSPALDCW